MSFLINLALMALIGVVFYTWWRARKVNRPMLGNPGGNDEFGPMEKGADSPAAQAQQAHAQAMEQAFEARRDTVLDLIYSRTSSPEIPVQLKLRDWIDMGFYVEGGAYWAGAQQYTYYLIERGYVRAFDTEGDELSAERVLRDRPDTFQLTPSEFQRRYHERQRGASN